MCVISFGPYFIFTDFFKTETVFWFFFYLKLYEESIGRIVIVEKPDTFDLKFFLIFPETTIPPPLSWYAFK